MALGLTGPALMPGCEASPRFYCLWLPSSAWELTVGRLRFPSPEGKQKLPGFPSQAELGTEVQNR